MWHALDDDGKPLPSGKYILSLETQNYNDMIKKFTTQQQCPSFEVVFIDEAQDLSLLQWDMIKLLQQNSKDVFRTYYKFLI